MSDAATLRILDAALNRAAEGLRVAEDYVRFVLDDGHLTGELKRLRHDLAAAAEAIPWPDRRAARDTLADVGTAITTASEAARRDARDVCQASFERTKQSLRSLEEFAKVAAPAAAARFETLRYRLYTLEAAVGRTQDAAERLAGVRLYVLVDGRESAAAFEALIGELVAAGVGAIQLRDKKLADRELIARGRLLVELCRRGHIQPRALPGGNVAPANRSQAPTDPRAEPGAEARGPVVIINDRVDVAAAVDADGVHLGQEDMTVKDARQIVGPRKLVGVSTHSIEQARGAVLEGANYIGVGPTFPSRTKEFDEFPGIALAKSVAAEIKLPAFAIGGIDARNVAQVLAAGITRIAVSSAVTEAPSPARAVAELRESLGG